MKQMAALANHDDEDNEDNEDELLIDDSYD